jgi:hypothetical protein
MTKSLHELKKNKTNKKGNTITDSDYFLRDKGIEADKKNVIDMTPTPAKVTRQPKADA